MAGNYGGRCPARGEEWLSGTNPGPLRPRFSFTGGMYDQVLQKTGHVPKENTWVPAGEQQPGMAKLGGRIPGRTARNTMAAFSRKKTVSKDARGCILFTGSSRTRIRPPGPGGLPGAAVHPVKRPLLQKNPVPAVFDRVFRNRPFSPSNTGTVTAR
jgi:hypothetical protein